MGGYDIIERKAAAFFSTV